MSAEAPEAYKRPEIPEEVKPYLVEGSDFFLDSKKITDALESGALDSETFAKAIGLTTIADRLAEWESTSEDEWERIKRLFGERRFERHLKKKDVMLAQLAARSGYTPVADNTEVAIKSSNFEALSKDIADWLGDHAASVVDSDTRATLNSDEVQDKLSRTDHSADNYYNAAHVELSLEYPALSHAIRLNYPYYPSKGKDEALIRILFYDHASGEDKISCQADILSVLKFLNYLKEKGHSVSCSLSQDLRPFVIR